MRLRSGENAAFWNLTILSCGCPLAGLKDAERNSFPPIVRSIACRSSINFAGPRPVAVTLAAAARLSKIDTT